MKKVLIATPCYAGEIRADFAMTTLDAMSVKNEKVRDDLEFDVLFLHPESLITRGRDTLAHVFLHHERWEDFTHLLFIDADMYSESGRGTLLKLIDTSSVDPDEDPYDVVCGVYARKRIEWEKVLVAAKAMLEGKLKGPPELLKHFASPPIGIGPQVRLQELAWYVEHDTPMPWTFGGTGCMLIRKNVLVSLANKHQELVYNSDRAGFGIIPYGDPIVGMFSTEIYHQFPGSFGRAYMSEDYAFTLRSIWAGHNVWLHPNVRFVHQGNYDYHTCMSGITLETIAE